ncbi:hypothetical protein J4218_03495 [Candidatus Pacearchaeota archaeon]|nr:hypothetical protein [Candidatus Pacearchaeota archaeon]
MALTDILKKAMIAGTLLVPTISSAQEPVQNRPLFPDTYNQAQEQSEKPTIPEIVENRDRTIKSYKIGQTWHYSTKPNQITWSYSKEAGWCIIDKNGGVISLEKAVVRKTNGTIDRFIDFSNKPNNTHTAYYPVYPCNECGQHHPETNRTSPNGLYKSKSDIIFGFREK